jgi:hypothetical protein
MRFFFGGYTTDDVSNGADTKLIDTAKIKGSFDGTEGVSGKRPLLS